ncbi:putative ABC transport system permease protein [Microbacterium lacticum]|uniref:Putative ABC transport system permease protein n=2 Tax=Microbacterium lacticum TaxID=33885 RepID=A0A543K6B1_9MICO|nr:ABC transporter permease [Microbacterium lacticum]TQM90592.1 putative ABC transport system permease protein [Microbacterium lacticum]
MSAPVTRRAPAAPRTSASPDVASGSAAPRGAGSGAWLRERGMGATVLVAAISTAFGVLLLSATGYIGAWLAADPTLGGSDMVTAIIGVLSVLLVGVAVYVASIVTANTFATIIAGRTRTIALLRLIGATARSQRRTVAGQGFAVGVIGAVIGLVSGTAAAAVLLRWADASLGITSDYAVLQPTLVIPAVVVALTTWAGAWSGSRRVLAVTPLQAISGSTPRSHDDLAGARGRRVGAILLLLFGAALLALGVVVGLVSPLGVVVAFFGGVLSFTGLALAAVLIMPPLLRLTGRLFGRSAAARLAAENALRYPERSSRMAIGVVMGVTLVVMFAVANESVKAVLSASAGGEPPAEMNQLMDTFAAIMMGLVAVSAVIAAVGLVNLLTIGVVQRRRELGLLRALGLTSRQVRRVVLLEAVHVTITSLALGLVLGILYGWIAAQSLLGAVRVPPAGEAPTLVAPAVPWLPVLVVVGATAVLTVVAAVVPTRVATRVTAVEALAE